MIIFLLYGSLFVSDLMNYYSVSGDVNSPTDGQIILPGSCVRKLKVDKLWRKSSLS